MTLNNDLVTLTVTLISTIAVLDFVDARGISVFTNTSCLVNTKHHITLGI